MILGSLPGQASIAVQQYYAHPRNQFWRLMQALLQWPEPLDYPQRLQALEQRGILLWDVIGSAQRPGSLDSAIQAHSIEPNDIAGLLARQPNLKLIAFNGQTAAKVFERQVKPRLTCALPPCLILPSSSPAHASLNFAQKLEGWQALLAFLDP